MENDDISIFEATLKRRSIDRTQDFWSSDIYRLGDREDGSNHYTGVRTYLKEPTTEFPDPGCFIVFKGGKGSAFCRTSPGDLRNLANWLWEQSDIIDGHASELKQKSLECWKLHDLAKSVDGLPASFDPSQLSTLKDSFKHLMDSWGPQNT